MQLRYTSPDTLTSTSGAPDTWVFALNSLFDPDVTNAGHQPRALDAMGTLYTNYIVRSAEIELTVIPATVTTACVCCFYVSQTNTAASLTMAEGREQKGAVWKPVLANAGIGRITYHIDIAEWLGVTEDVLETSQYQAQITANPSDILYGIFMFATLDGSTLNGYVDVDLKQNSVFLQPKQLSNS